MIQATVDRLEGLIPPERTMVLTNEALVEAVRRQLPQLPPQSVIGEPCKRDTAPCVGLASLLAQSRDGDATLVVLPADHVISDEAAFRRGIEHAARLVEQSPGRLVTFGIAPTYPATTFGYIERGDSLGGDQPIPTFAVRQFREKPPVEVAKEYIAAGRYYWNAGIFVWKAATIARALAEFEPDMYRHLETIAASVPKGALSAPTASGGAFQQALQHEFAAIKGKSIDYAVLERYRDVAVVEAPFPWDDVGNWRSLARLRGTDAHGNTIVGKHLGIGTRDTIVSGDDEHLIVTVGLSDCIVVHTPDATLVASKRDEEQLRQVVDMIREKGWEEYL
jgi:mannose-1-phosphate guanylyltransferase